MIELRWHVDDPVPFVQAEVADVPGRLLQHLYEEVEHVTGPRLAFSRGRVERALREAVQEAVRSSPVPGLSVSCALTTRG